MGYVAITETGNYLVLCDNHGFKDLSRTPNLNQATVFEAGFNNRRIKVLSNKDTILFDRCTKIPAKITRVVTLVKDG